MSTTIVDRCDVAAYRSWTNRRLAPAYVRGLPSWVWMSAMRHRQQRSRAVT